MKVAVGKAKPDDLMASWERFPKATKGNAMRLMALWHRPLMSDSDRREWEAITGDDQITTRVLWDYIRASLVNGL
jgi:hypothetical protein